LSCRFTFMSIESAPRAKASTRARATSTFVKVA
jgi:hypothetical protein